MGAAIFVYSAQRTVSTAIVLLYQTGRRERSETLDRQLLQEPHANARRASGQDWLSERSLPLAAQVLLFTKCC